MIDTMKARWIRTWVAATAAATLLVPSLAAAQEGTWEDAPAENAPAAAPAPEAQSAVPAPAPAAQDQQYDDRDPAALTDFAAELESYGYWRDDPTYGRVWVPHQSAVGADFAPYVTSGHWAVGEDGNYLWVSDLPFGWVVFHYGRWVWIDGVGWSWVPGRQYAPAWVVWRTPYAGYDYVGWAPMPPDYIWWDGVAVGVWFGVYTPWVFCPSGYFYYPGMYRYVVRDHYYVQQIASHSSRYNGAPGYAPWAGPSRSAMHIPAKAVPKSHTPANPKAMNAARHKGAYGHGTPAAKVIHPGGRPSEGSGMRSMASSSRNWGSLRGGSRTINGSSGGSRTASSSRLAGHSYSNASSRSLSGTSYEPLRSSRSLGSGYNYRTSGTSSFTPGPSYRPSPSLGSSYRPSPSFGSSYRPSPSFGSGSSYRSSPSFSSGPSYRSSPSFSSGPSYRSAPSAPSYHPTQSFGGGGFRGGGGGFRGGGGGFHGGGGRR